MTPTKVFLKDLKELCDKHKVRLKLVDAYAVYQDGCATGGSFGGVRKMVLTCATARPDWLYILVHEACHLDQYLYDQDIWINKGDSYDYMGDWLLNQRIKDIDKHINNVQDLEMDCEMRAVRKIRKYKLPIKVSEYIQRANAYIYFFAYLKHSRKWPGSKKSPYANEEIWKKMPKKFLTTYRKLPKKYFNLYETHL